MDDSDEMPSITATSPAVSASVSTSFSRSVSTVISESTFTREPSPLLRPPASTSTSNTTHSMALVVLDSVLPAVISVLLLVLALLLWLLLRRRRQAVVSLVPRLIPPARSVRTSTPSTVVFRTRRQSSTLLDANAVTRKGALQLVNAPPSIDDSSRVSPASGPRSSCATMVAPGQGRQSEVCESTVPAPPHSVGRVEDGPGYVAI